MCRKGLLPSYCSIELLPDNGAYECRGLMLHHICELSNMTFSAIFDLVCLACVMVLCLYVHICVLL